MHKVFCCGNLKESNYLEDLDGDETIILKCTLNKMAEVAGRSLTCAENGTPGSAGYHRVAQPGTDFDVSVNCSLLGPIYRVSP